MRTPANASRRAPAAAGRPLLLGSFFLLPLLPVVAFAGSLRIQVDGRFVTADAGGTVRQALQEARIQVGPDDLVTPPLEAPAPDGGLVRVTRVSYQSTVVEEKIPYKIQIQPASRGNRPYHPTVTRPGQPGLKRITYRVRMVDGQEAGREVVATELVREPLNAVVTARKPQVLGSRGAYAGVRSFKVFATAYDPGPGSCGKYANGITCNGKRAGYGIIAVDPKVIPLGTKLHVPGYGYGIAADVGRAIQGNRVDLGFNSRKAALAWGKQLVTIEIVD